MAWPKPKHIYPNGDATVTQSQWQTLCLAIFRGQITKAAAIYEMKLKIQAISGMGFDEISAKASRLTDGGMWPFSYGPEKLLKEEQRIDIRNLLSNG